MTTIHSETKLEIETIFLGGEYTARVVSRPAIRVVRRRENEAIFLLKTLLSKIWAEMPEGNIEILLRKAASIQATIPQWASIIA